VYWRKRTDGFHFDDDRIIDKQIDTIANFEPHALIYERKGHLGLNIKAALA
jgi:hypothetical protein